MANYDLSKVMSLADAQAMYKDLRDRMKEIEVPVEDVMVNGVSVVVNGIANIPAIPTVPVTDVKIDGTSILQNGVANIPKASASAYGVIKIGEGLNLSVNKLVTNQASDVYLKGGTETYRVIVPYNQHKAVYYGLSKLAGEDLKNVTATVGTYPDSSKQAIQKLFGLDGIFGDYQNGITASKAYAVGDTFIMDGKRYRVTAAISDGGLITVGTNCELDPLDGEILKRSMIGTGLIWHSASRKLITNPAGDNTIKAGTSSNLPITPLYIPAAAFYGLSRAAGDTTQTSSSNPIGTYTAEAKAAILAMLGANGNGLQILNGTLATDSASTTSIKNGSNSYAPIVSSHVHDAAFFGLSKAAGVDLANVQDVVVGTYPQNSKTAIQSMLGVSTGAILIENVSGSTPTLTCLPNVRYKCGEVSTISITPPASGSCEVIFESGSTATLLTVPNTVKFPPWFDATALETGMIYDIIITDGVYGAVMSWAS